jgi:hypothetical protein
MSVGHHHKEPNLFAETPRIRATLHRLLSQPDAIALMRRWQRVDFEHDIVYLAGYNVWGTTKFADRDFVRALYDPAYAEHIIGTAINTGLSPDDTLHCIFTHEEVEKVILDADNPVDFYDYDETPGGFGAHEYGTFAEHEQVRAKGGNPHRYETGLERIIHFCAHKPLIRVPKDYACAPLLDDPDANERRVISTLRKMGIEDAFKLGKKGVDYSLSTGLDHCAACINWGGARDRELMTCAVVDGLVRTDRWCTKCEPEGTNGKETSQGQQAPEPPAAATPTP